MTVGINSQTSTTVGVTPPANGMNAPTNTPPAAPGGVIIDTGSGDDTIHVGVPPYPQSGESTSDQGSATADEQSNIWSNSSTKEQTAPLAKAAPTTTPPPGQEPPPAPPQGPGAPINVNSGSGDDTIHVGVPPHPQSGEGTSDQGSATADEQSNIWSNSSTKEQTAPPAKAAPTTPPPPGQEPPPAPPHGPGAPINVDSGSGDDEVIVDAPPGAPVKVDSGSGDDTIHVRIPPHPQSKETPTTPPPGQEPPPPPPQGPETPTTPPPGQEPPPAPPQGPETPTTPPPGQEPPPAPPQGPGAPIIVDSGSGDDTVVIGTPPTPPETESTEPVAANETGRIWGDPHFVGGDGGKFDVQGEPNKIYDLLSDEGLDFRGRFDGWGDGITVVGETGLTVGKDEVKDNVEFRKDSTANLNDQVMEEGKAYDLADGGTAKLENGTLTLTTAEGYSIKQTANGSGERAYINVDVSTGEAGVDNGKLPDGLLGQTFDADSAARDGKTGKGAQGEGAIEGTIGDYERTSLNPVRDPQTETSGPADEPVAAGETGRIWGDPHFVGGDGGKFDVQGEANKTYDLLSDKGLDLRGRFDGWGEGITVVGETGLTVGEGWKSDKVEFRKDGTAYINDSQMEAGKSYDLADGGAATIKDGALTVTTAEGYSIKQTSNGSGERAYINIDVSTGEEGVDNGKMPGGLLGQTFDADSEARNGKTGKGAQGEGAIDNPISDYEKKSLDPVRESEFNHARAAAAAAAFETVTKTITGSGDDEVEIVVPGKHDIDLGSGDDNLSVNFNDTTGKSSASITGGGGVDIVNLNGLEADYTVSKEDDKTVYTDKSGNTITVADDVETVRFEGETESA